MAVGLYYFKIKKGINSDIIIKRREKDAAILAFKNYLTTQPGKTEWLGKWNGKDFDDNNFDALTAAAAKS